MSINKIEVIISHFKEHPFVDFRVKEPDMYDISAIGIENCHPDFIKNNQFDLENYCRSIICKLLELPNIELKPFLKYQCQQVKDPFYWLNRLELLIELNHPLFITDLSKYAKLQVVIESIKEKVQQCGQYNLEPIFDFFQLKSELNKIEDDMEKLLLLKSKKTEFLQYNAIHNNKLSESFIIAIDYEISYLLEYQTLRGQIKGQMNGQISSDLSKNIKINGNLNILVEAFFQMMNEIVVGEKPYLEATIKDISEMIEKNFIDRNGNKLSLATIQTILSPAKCEKRPKGDKRVSLEKYF